MAATKSLPDRIFDALGETSQAVIERAKAGNERTGRVVGAFIRETEWLQTEALGVGRQIVASPTDLIGNTGVLYQKTIEAQERAFEFGRQWIDEMATATRETRGALERIGRANVAVAQPAVEAAREIASRTRQVIQPGLTQVSQAAQAATRATARRTSSNEEAA
jgi:hypothetical protein